MITGIKETYITTVFSITFFHFHFRHSSPSTSLLLILPCRCSIIFKYIIFEHIAVIDILKIAL